MTYPNERQVEYWTSRAIEEYFENQNYSIVVLPNSQITERWIPFDHLFQLSRWKVFGLQYKRLYPNPDRWRLGQRQHQQLQQFPWIYYGFSHDRSNLEHRNALHLLQITSSKFDFGKELNPADLGSFIRILPYASWGVFVKGLFSCHFGWPMENREFFRDVLGIARDMKDILVDYYLVALDQPKVIRISSAIQDIGEEDPYDFGSPPVS